jgi:hypothetical protein
MRQVHIGNKWVNGLPSDVGQRFRFMTAGGWQYGTYAPEPAPEVVDMRITKLAFKQRFTADERIAIREAAAVNPQIYDFEDLVNAATYIDLSRADTISAVNAIEQAGLIAEGRAIEIIGPPINEIERYME